MIEKKKKKEEIELKRALIEKVEDLPKYVLHGDLKCLVFNEDVKYNSFGVIGLKGS